MWYHVKRSSAHMKVSVEIDSAGQGRSVGEKAAKNRVKSSSPCAGPARYCNAEEDSQSRRARQWGHSQGSRPADNAQQANQWKIWWNLILTTEKGKQLLVVFECYSLTLYAESQHTPESISCEGEKSTPQAQLKQGPHSKSNLLIAVLLLHCSI